MLDPQRVGRTWGFWRPVQETYERMIADAGARPYDPDAWTEAWRHREGWPRLSEADNFDPTPSGAPAHRRERFDFAAHGRLCVDMIDPSSPIHQIQIESSTGRSRTRGALGGHDRCTVQQGRHGYSRRRPQTGRHIRRARSGGGVAGPGRRGATILQRARESCSAVHALCRHPSTWRSMSKIVEPRNRIRERSSRRPTDA